MEPYRRQFKTTIVIYPTALQQTTICKLIAGKKDALLEATFSILLELFRLIHPFAGIFYAHFEGLLICQTFF